MVNNGVLQDDVGLAMKNRIGYLCKVIFQGDIMTLWAQLSKTKKKRVQDQILQEFQPIAGGAEAPIAWIREQMVNVLKHARSDVTQAVKNRRERPWFCSAHKWEREMRLHAENP